MRPTLESKLLNFCQFSSLEKTMDMHHKFSGRTHVLGESCTDGDRDGRDNFYFISLYIFILNHVDVCPIKNLNEREKKASDDSLCLTGLHRSDR